VWCVRLCLLLYGCLAPSILTELESYRNETHMEKTRPTARSWCCDYARIMLRSAVVCRRNFSGVRVHVGKRRTSSAPCTVAFARDNRSGWRIRCQFLRIKRHNPVYIYLYMCIYHYIYMYMCTYIYMYYKYAHIFIYLFCALFIHVNALIYLYTYIHVLLVDQVHRDNNVWNMTHTDSKALWGGYD